MSTMSSTNIITSASSLAMILSIFKPTDAFVSCGRIHGVEPAQSLTTAGNVYRRDMSLFVKSRRSRASSYSAIGTTGIGNKKNSKYIRIQPRNVRGNRRVFELQTAVTTLSKTLPNGGTATVDLHSQLHFGDDSYFQFYNEKEFQEKYNQVFYELIVSDDMLQRNPNGSKYLEPLQNSSYKNPIAPPPTDTNTANSYGLKCQLDVIDYTKPDWIHCDTTREEYQDIVQKSMNIKNSNTGADVPIWALASTATAPLQEYTSALVRPLTPSTANSNNMSGSFTSRRLFSNLFLDGDTLATFFRLLLWSFSPSPEVSILLLDWSSLVDPKPTGMISPIFIPVMEALLTGNLVEARQLVFAQLIVSGQTSGGRDALLVKKRNDVAMRKFIKCVDQDGASSSSSRNAILYGAMHCQDLQKRFEKLGYTVINTEWRTAWSTSVPTFGSTENSDVTFSLSVPSSTSNKDDASRRSWGNFAFSASDQNDIAIGLVLVPLYLLIGGFDWIQTVKDIAQSLDQGAIVDCFAIAAFYLMRHLVMYLGLSKFVVEWDGEIKLFGES